jgi:hypothetical protein
LVGLIIDENNQFLESGSETGATDIGREFLKVLERYRS